MYKGMNEKEYTSFSKLCIAEAMKEELKDMEKEFKEGFNKLISINKDNEHLFMLTSEQRDQLFKAMENVLNGKIEEVTKEYKITCKG